ncbi:MAG: adenosine kinase [Alphaproteobacteria bacterium]|nr:adenosine kinase [Alphaproteobacteria bacterium]
MPKTYELTGLGNAIVDVIAKVEESFLADYEITKGSMTLIDETRAKGLYDALGVAHEVSGGSAANTMAGFASFGGKGAFMGKVANDQLGGIFTHDMRAEGVHFATPPLANGPETARCMIVVTPDAQRSMSTYLGASVEFSESDVDEALIADSQIIYLEGYLFDKDAAKKAYYRATKAAKAAGTKVALSLSDSFCVDRHRADFLKLIENDVDILFANEAEILSLFQTKSFEEAATQIKGKCEVAVLTRSEKGSVIVSASENISVAIQPVADVMDTTGAGDQYAAGFLFGYARNMPLARCGALGSLAAAEVISHIGPRPETSLAKLAHEKLGLPQAA